MLSFLGAEEKAKKEQRRKERKREKKDKNDKKDKKAKKEKKEKKRKERERGDGESEKHRHKRRHKEEGAKDSQNQKVDVFRKLKERENDCLEKSSLTVERELLPSTSQNSCDSTVNSNELPKQKEKQPLDGRRNNDSESIIRIRLPLRRLKDPELMTMTNNDQQKLCPSRETKLDTSQRDTREQPVKQQQPCSTSAPGHASKPLEEKRRDHVFTTKLAKEKKFKPTSQETFQPSSLCRICPPSMAVQFLNVVENWVPSTIERRVELINSEDEECWWSMNKPSSHNFGTERCKQLSRNNETKEVISSSVAWPRARLLLEADVHALPYTVPF
ncbi:glutamic acid-rich protein isoform X2 [Eutrema salsugineum]|uniref:glutamic acid-rich protein isoform X2 n=1 Tax=Eutrema salsugineum TaxID=72664 RepID=UPI000CED6580|nr:glutamic acid-rich protein isoform X2 [Eutrema salsugineum]